MSQSYRISKSNRTDKKLMVETPGGKVIHFGATGYSDYPHHKDLIRKHKYITRHKASEDWSRSGIETAGFWSRWILWNKETMRDSIRDTERRAGIRIVRRKK